MRKVFAAALVMLMALMGMSAAAETKATTEPIKALGSGYYAVLFSNGYTGFCIDNLEAWTGRNQEFTEADSMGLVGAMSNVPLYVTYNAYASEDLKTNLYNPNNPDDKKYDGMYIDQYLKYALIHHHNKVFVKNGTGGYYDITYVDSANNLNMGHLCWAFSDSRFLKIKLGMSNDDYRKITGYGIIGPVLNVMVDTIANAPAADDAEKIPDHSSRKYVIEPATETQPATEAIFDFMVLNSIPSSDANKQKVQDYFCYKVTYFRDVWVDEKAPLILNASIPDTYAISYQWAYENDNGEFIDIENANTGTYSPTDEATTAYDGKRYRCTVVAGSTSSKPNYKSDYIFKVDVKGVQPEEPEQNTAPTITPTTDQNKVFTAAEDEITLSVSGADADGDPLAYTWYEIIDGAPSVVTQGVVTDSVNNTSTLTLDPTAEDNNRKFYCVVTDGKEGTTPAPSATFTLKALTIDWASKPTGVVKEDESVTLKVTEKNADTLTWYVNKNDGAGYQQVIAADGTVSEGGKTFTSKPVQPGWKGYRYKCEATNGAKSAYTTEYVLDTGAAPEIISTTPTNPSDIVVPEGSGVTLGVEATGDELTYQWFKSTDGGVTFTEVGDDENQYNAPAEDVESGNVYRCEVTNPYGEDSQDFTVSSKCKLPAILSPDANQTCVVTDGDPVKLCVVLEEDVTYQWALSEDGGATFCDINDATTSELVFDPIDLKQNGFIYRCTVTNSCGSVTRKFTMVVNPSFGGDAPEFVRPETDIQDEPYREGGQLSLFAALKEQNATSFEWYVKRGDAEAQLLEGENSDTLVLENCAIEDDGTLYHCVAKNRNGKDTSMTFRLVLTGDKPVFISPTENTPLEFVEGESLILTAQAEGADTYQWYVDKGDGQLVPVHGADQSSYTTEKLTGEQDGWAYVCVAENRFGEATSKAYILCRIELPQMPGTGDDSMLFAWIALMMGGMAGGLLLCGKRRAIR